MKKKKKGFTLVELLAVIVILLVILSIAIPPLLGVLNESRSKTYSLTVKSIENSAKLYVGDHPEEFGDSDVFYYTIADLCSKEYLACPVYNPDTEKEMTGYVKIIRNANSAFEYTYADGTPPVIVNPPKLAAGMTPVKWNGTSWVDTTVSDTEWYDYENKIWANAETADGSMWVWIPRYIYKISRGWHSSSAGIIDVQFSKGIDDNWNSSAIGSINTDTTANASNNKWTNHPGFTFGDKELTGIWVAKFEVSAPEASSCYIGQDYDNCDVTNLLPRIVPNVHPWTYLIIGNMFTVLRNMETSNDYGWGTTGNGIDTHMMKNVEWGAVAYLSKSTFGKNTEQVWVNAASEPNVTGCGGEGESSSYTNGCLYTYETENGQEASTTGNVYGVYDMSGGAIEYVSAYVDNGVSNLTSTGNSIYTADPKYKDVYRVGTPESAATNYALTSEHKGDAYYETSGTYDWWNGWYSDYSFMPDGSSVFFSRGGSNGSSSGAGIFNSDANNWGDHYNYRAFRPTLLVDTGL